MLGEPEKVAKNKPNRKSLEICAIDSAGISTSKETVIANLYFTYNRESWLRSRTKTLKVCEAIKAHEFGLQPCREL